MKHSLKLISMAALVLGTSIISFGAGGFQRPRNAAKPVPRTVHFREVNGRGLVVRAWINGAGPFNFAVDTGAGAILISRQVAAEAHVAIINGGNVSVSGLSGVRGAARPARIEALALGDVENYLPGKGDVLVTEGLPADLDGVMDPTEAFSPFGYVIDIPRRELSAFEPQDDPVQTNRLPNEGAVVPWLRETHGRRPFVLLGDGRKALLDTGSTLGLAVRDHQVPVRVNGNYSVRDVGGGEVSARRVAPTTVSIGSLELRNIPTDVVSGAAVDAPTLLGLNALRPFRLRFDPVHRLIEIAVADGDRDSR